MKLAAADVQTVVIPGAGHWVAEEAPEELLAGTDRVPGPVPRWRGRGARDSRKERHTRGNQQRKSPTTGEGSAGPRPTKRTRSS